MSGNLLWASDGGGTIGDINGLHRPSNIFGSGSVLAGSGANIGNINRSILTNPGGAGVWKAENSAQTAIATINQGIQVVAKTGNYQLLFTDSNGTFTNTGAAGEVDITLPASVVGQIFYFNIQAAQTLKVIASGTDKIRNAGTLSAAGGAASAATVGNSIVLICVAAGEWDVMSIVGTWTVA